MSISFDSEISMPNLKILLAEDNEINQHLMLRILNRVGYQATLAKTGVQVLNKLDREEFDLVLMDIQMPAMDGITTTRLIRIHYPPERQPRIIALTAEASTSERDRFLMVGMDGVLTKPVQLDELIATLEAIPAKRGLPPARERREGEPAPLNEFAVLDEEVLRDFTSLMGAEAHGALDQLIDLFKEGAPKLAGEIERACQNLDAERLAASLHTLKGSGGQVGGKRLEQLCKRLELLLKRTGVEGLTVFVTGVRQEIESLSAALDEYRDSLPLAGDE